MEAVHCQASDLRHSVDFNKKGRAAWIWGRSCNAIKPVSRWRSYELWLIHQAGYECTGMQASRDEKAKVAPKRKCLEAAVFLRRMSS
jgi:hypothetical protein